MSGDKQSLLEQLGGVDTGETAAPNPQAAIREFSADSAEAADLAKHSLDFLAGLVIPTVFAYLFPPIFKEVWAWLKEHTHKIRAFPQLALGLPRGFAKTTVIKLYAIYCIFFTQKRFILLIGATATLAENTLSDIIDMLEEPNVKRIFGDWKLAVTKDTQSIKKFGYRGRNITLAAIGAEGSLRGLNIRNDRPDVMIFDDIQSKECAQSETQSKNLLTWMIGTAMKAKSPTGCVFLFLANMYPTPHSILRKLKYNPTWTKFIVGGILADGTSLWEDLQPIEQLMTEFENDLAMGHPEIFYSEVLNDENAANNNLVDLSKLPELPREVGDIPVGSFIVIDPANDKSTSDDVSIGYFEVHDAKPVLEELTAEILSPGETIRKALTYALTHNCRLIAIEANAYQYSLLYWFDFICKQLQIEGIQCVPVYSGSRSKNTRIKDWLLGYAKGDSFCSDKCRAQLHTQITGWNPLRRDNVDGVLDLMTYCEKVMVAYSEYVVSQGLIAQQSYESLEVPDFNTSF